MGVSIRPLQRRAAADALLSDLAETVHWISQAAVHPRPLRALVERTRRLTEGEAQSSEEESIDVTIWREPCDSVFEGIDLGGVAELRIGDQLVRGGGDSPRPYVFGGEIVAETHYTWRVRMVRQQTHQVGVGNISRGG